MSNWRDRQRVPIIKPELAPDLMMSSKPKTFVFYYYSHNIPVWSGSDTRQRHLVQSGPVFCTPRSICDATKQLICSTATPVDMPSRLFGVDLRLPTPQTERPHFKTKTSPSSSVTELRRSSIASMDHIKRPTLPSLGKKSDKKDKERSLSKVRLSWVE